jgi:glycine dehydrogenase subunit 1
VQSPNFFGVIEDIPAIAEIAHQKGALLIVSIAEAISLGIVRPPVEADIVSMEAQSFGVALSYGGPFCGVIAAKEQFLRQMPGRLAGQTVDSNGNRGFVLTLSTREQHIRREKATSNICTNSGLCALAFSIHMSLLGETGLRQLAEVNHARARELKAALSRVPGVEVLAPRYFNELAVRVAGDAAALVEACLADGVVAGVPFSRLDPKAGLDDVLLLAATETTTSDDIAALTRALQRNLGR